MMKSLEEAAGGRASRVFTMQKELLAHKQLVASALVALAILTLGIVSHFKKAPRTDHSPQTLPVGTMVDREASTTIADRDSDVDGLPDWEEHLYGSDPMKFDTDGDGTPDGEEVKEGRDPAKANAAKAGETPSDRLAVLSDPNFATSSTDILGVKKDFFAKFLAKEADGIRQTTYLGLLKRFDAKKVTPTTQLVDLSITSDNGKEALRAYGNEFGKLIERYTKRTHRTEDEIMRDAMRASTTANMSELQLPAIDYKNFALDLKALRVPSIVAPYHLEIVNGYERMSLGLLAMQSLFVDPVVGAGGYEAYTKGKADVTEGYASVIVVFAKEGVVFEKNEPGAPFYFMPPTASSSINQYDL